MNTITLENLPQAIRENKLRELAIIIVKYQKFKTSIIALKAAHLGYAKGSLGAYVQFGLEYLNEGKCNKRGGKLFNYIDEVLKKCIQPLTPSIGQCRMPRTRQKCTPLGAQPKDVVLPVQKILANLADIQYAVQMDNNIRLCNSVEFAQAFKEGLSFMGCNSAKVVKIKIEECE